ncbi:classical arabinogalactan protein 9-like [Nymphaea colorata]|uniref:classical arabinogalactan protein 9-like n=1 Tax=Nymphaea colorata TaxID=210225 RepID=UPI00129DE39A|nr:classical arabinogalactan protein 9-like [Nymphaea colorata]
MAALSPPDHDACNLKKTRRNYEGRRSGGNWAMVIHFRRNLFSLVIVVALFMSVVDGQYDFPQEGPPPPPPDWSAPPPEEYVPPPQPPDWSAPPPEEYVLPPQPSDWPFPSPEEYVPPPPPPDWPFRSPEQYVLPPPPSPPDPPVHLGTIVGSVVGAVPVIALIGVAVMLKYKQKIAEGDQEQPAPAAPANVGNRSAVEETTSPAKESGSHATSEVSSNRTTDGTMLVAAAECHFTDSRIRSITKNLGLVI